MKYVVCTVAVAPLRNENAHRSEMVSQLLLGEFAELLDISGDFVKIRCLYDGYEGWCQKAQLQETDQYLSTSVFVVKSIGKASINGLDCRISAGTPVYATDRMVQLGLYNVLYPSMHNADAMLQEFNPVNIRHLASLYLNTPYLWGGKSVFGIDCSGFSQQIFKMLGIYLPRDAYQQATSGEVIGFLEEVQCGDLAFFDNEEGKITHVGIMLDQSSIIHASGKVRIDRIDHSGIINAETGKRTHKLRLLKRYKK